jgi:uncharacterized protein YkwD
MGTLFNGGSEMRRAIALSSVILLCVGNLSVADNETQKTKNQKEASESKKPKKTPHAWLTEHATIQRLLKYHNEERARYSLPPLKIDPKMCLAAQKHAVWMAETGYYTHSNLPWPEIIHHGPRSARGAVDGWIWSPSHHGIMLSGAKKVGFGYMVLHGQTYWVGVFQ